MLHRSPSRITIASENKQTCVPATVTYSVATIFFIIALRYDRSHRFSLDPESPPNPHRDPVTDDDKMRRTLARW